MIWLAMLIPLIGCAVAFYHFQKQIVWWEVLLVNAVPLLIILLCKFTIQTALVHDTQYRGALIVEARYYEYWSTWETKTCSRQVEDGEDCTGSGTDRRCTTKYRTEYYDCSECDENSEYWEAYDSEGGSWRISEEQYNEFKKRWNATPVFVDMKRDIDKHGSCGKDGDAYSIKWDNNPMTSEPTTSTQGYTNKIQATKRSFDLKDISKSEAKKYGLYDYPSIIGKYTQHNILGLERFKYIDVRQRDSAVKMFNYFNGEYGPKRKIRLFIALFSGKPLDIAIKQKDYWDGGNKNEVVVCIDADTLTGKINWVQAFTWSANKRVAIDLREDISEMNHLQLTQLYKVVEASTKDFIYRNFDEFDYLEVEVPEWEMWLVYILTIISTGGLLFFCHQNEFEQEDDSPLYEQ